MTDIGANRNRTEPNLTNYFFYFSGVHNSPAVTREAAE